MATSTLKELITQYGVPLNVKKPTWYGSYFFRAESVNHNGTINGTIIKNGLKHERKSFSESENMELFSTSQVQKKSSSPTKQVENPNHLDTDKSHYISGVTKLFVKQSNEIVPAIFIRFDVKEGNDVIYIKVQGKNEAGFYTFPQSHYVFPNKDDAQSNLDKQYRQFGISPSRSIIKAFQTKPVARKPSENQKIEFKYEKDYHKQVDAELQANLIAPNKKKSSALHDKYYADENLKGAIVAAREDGSMLDDFTFITHQIQKDSAEKQIDSAQKEINTIESIRQKPYFARVDCGTSMKELHTVYLGDKDIDNYVVSWRHPEYGNAYYQSDLIQGRGDIVLALRRIVNIQNGRFDSFDDDINLYSIAEDKLCSKAPPLDTATDELLLRLLQESRADKTTHDIIKTIQSEQYEIITSNFTQNAVVNGCAGSGKTMIMYHRLSYMAYNYLSYLGREFNPESVYIISPSAFFDSSNNALLAKLSINNIRQAPFYSQIEHLLDRYCANHNIIPFYGLVEHVEAHGSQPKNFFSSAEFNNFNNRCKATDTDSNEFKQWVLSIANMILESREFKPIILDEFPTTAKEVNALFATSEYYYNDCFAKKGSEQFYSKFAVTGISLDNIVLALNRTHDKTSSRYLQRKKRVNKSLGLLKCCLALTPKVDDKSNILTDITDFWSLVSSPTVYEKMLSVIVAERLLETVSTIKSKSSKYILKYLWAYKYLYTEEYAEPIKLYILQILSNKYGAIIEDPALIFIDEFQNYSHFEIKCLRSAFDSPVFNLFGDYDQRIENKGSDLKSKLDSLLSPNSYNINVNYRNAKPITEYINRQVHKNMQSIGVDGTVIETTLDRCKFNISNRTAIICKDLKLATTFLKRYIDISTINNSTTTKELLIDKYTLMTILDCKGLEFDTVYVFDYNMSENEKYVAYTRALDTLVVISDDLDALKKAEDETERKRKEEERLRKKAEKEHKKKQVMLEKLLSILHYVQVSQSAEIETKTIMSTDFELSDKSYKGEQVNKSSESGKPSKEADSVDETPTTRTVTSVELKTPPLAEQAITPNQILEEEIKKLQAYRYELERKEEESRKAELAKYERLYSLAMSKAETNDMLQLNEAVVLFETIIDFKNAIEMIAQTKAKISQITTKENTQKEAYRKQNLCQYCGGKFKGLFNKQCRKCGKKKDY